MLLSFSFTSSEKSLKNEVNPALPDFDKSVLDSHNPFLACSAPQHSPRDRLEGQETGSRAGSGKGVQLGQNCGVCPPTLFRTGTGGGEGMALEQVGRNQRPGLTRGTWFRPTCSPPHAALQCWNFRVASS